MYIREELAMDINLELIKRIISSDELCDKVNSLEYKDSYIKQIESYILSLCNNIGTINSNIEFINRYLKKFVVVGSNKEEIFFDKILLKLYDYNLTNEEFNSILSSFNYDEVKELLIKKFDQIVINKSNISDLEIVRMLSFYYYVCPNYALPSNYIDFFTHYFVSKNISLDYDLLVFYYKSFASCFALSKGINTSFEVVEYVSNDPYYDRRSKVIVYRQNIGDKVDSSILADIFYQIKYLYLVNSINSSNNYSYSFEQLRLVKEICLVSILGDDYYDKNYGDISFSNELKKQSRNTVRDYFLSIGINKVVNLDYDVLSITGDIDDETDKAISVDILFDLTLNRENPNLLKGLLKNYPILGCEYGRDKRKSLLKLLLDIYSNRKLLENLKKDLEWHNLKLGSDEDKLILPKIDRLNNKISLCSSYISVMSLSINNGDMTSYDLIRSISDLITYDTNNKMIQNDICMILCTIVPKKIKSLCLDRNLQYKENFKKRVIKCYLDSMGLVRNNLDTVYFMRVYASLEECIKAFSID